MTQIIHIRKATTDDAEAVSKIIMTLAHCFVTEPDSDAEVPYFNSVTPDSIQELIESPIREYFICEVNGEIAGLGSLRNNHHIGHLFVASPFQRQGIARKLWMELVALAQENGNEDGLTVNSSLFAIPFYERLGFKKVGERIDKSGVSFVPMKYNFHQSQQ